MTARRLLDKLRTVDGRGAAPQDAPSAVTAMAPEKKSLEQGPVNLLTASKKQGSGVSPHLLFDLFRIAQHVAATPYCMDVVFAFHGCGEFLAELANEHIDDL